MSIRRIGFNPFVQTANIIEAQRRIEAQHRVEAVEKHVGADDPALMTEEQALEALNAQHRAEMEALEAERAQKEREGEALRAQLTLADGYETAQRELVDLKGGKEAAKEAPPSARADTPGVSLAHLARANVYASVTRAERAAAEQLAALERAAAEQAATGGPGVEDDWMAAEVAALQVDGGAEVAAGEDNSWMAAELSALEAQAEALEEDEAVYSDPGADTFFASLDDIENLEQGRGAFDDAGANAFVASMDDIALLVPDAAPEAVPPVGAEPVALEPSVILAAAEVVPEAGPVPEEAPAAAAGAQQAPALGLPFDDA
ncbi:hypothetical protein ATI61_106631 [Archangium gephyra]|uniref:TolA protein n=1 Tax=Archangium gephyra TaxID=48 RepID=A0AAC8Q1U2_9BACT|nr:hypothetical protein [Archangium gephyra]AKI99256.1 TolA protein [Archangium gephyra]REG31161.1 hypothetical protein ATI61_106631 [Archangium gephyra]